MLSMGCKWKARREFLKSFKFNCSLLWNATCPDTFAQSHRSLAVHSAGGIAAKAEDLKRVKYADLLSSHIFLALPLKLLEFSVSTLSLVKSLGKRLS